MKGYETMQDCIDRIEEHISKYGYLENNMGYMRLKLLIKENANSGYPLLGEVLVQIDYWLSNGTLLSGNEIDELKQFLTKYFA